MKKLLTILVLLMAAMAYAADDAATGIGKGDDATAAPAAKGNNSPDDMGKPDDAGVEAVMTKTDNEMQNKGEDKQIMDREEVQARINSMKSDMEQKQQQVNAEAAGESERKQQMMMNQNEVRLAVQSMVQMREMLGEGIGEQVSQIAKQFNNSYMAQAKAEEKIAERGGLARFFAGGDHEAAKEIEAQQAQVQAKLQEMKQAMENADIDSEVQTMMQQQIQKLEQEQTRLQQVAEGELKSKGLLGWIWK